MTDTYRDRTAEAALLVAIRRTAGAEAATLQRTIQMATAKGTDTLRLDADHKRLDALWDRHRQCDLRLSKLEAEQSTKASIRVINQSGARAEIAITYPLDETRKVSFTRHVHWDGAAWVGRSTLTDHRVRYSFPVRAAREAA